ncbi:MAG TPA: hypothetical protein V6C81_07335 [Planktothrix sp.]|jgi:hypothetical protein
MSTIWTEFVDSSLCTWLILLAISIVAQFPFVKAVTGQPFKKTIVTTIKLQLPVAIGVVIIMAILLCGAKFDRRTVGMIEYFIFPTLVMPMQAYVLKTTRERDLILLWFGNFTVAMAFLCVSG